MKNDKFVQTFRRSTIGCLLFRGEAAILVLDPSLVQQNSKMLREYISNSLDICSLHESSSYMPCSDIELRTNDPSAINLQLWAWRQVSWCARSSRCAEKEIGNI